VAYQVIARKFRPQSFEDFVGQEHVTQTLINAMNSDRFPHAILLTGPRGTGKTTTARIIAKTLLCTNRQGNNPCGQCQSCVDVTEGRHLDVIEIDGASNNGVESIRELRETVGYMPSSGAYKVYIIDEVHMLSTSAFNALLKTLEEPPEQVIFIFATTEVQKIPATILSRCQRFDFRNHSLTDIKNHLKNICEQENIDAEESALLMIAKQANGSIRDSLTLLDQLISFSQGQLTLDAVMKALGLTDRNLLLSGLQAIAENNVDLMFQTVEQFKNSGSDPLLFCEEFLELIRNLLLVKLECHKKKTLEMSEHEMEELEKVSKHFEEAQVHLLFDVTLSGAQRLSHSSDAKLGLEMLLFKLLHLPRLTTSLPMTESQSKQEKRPEQTECRPERSEGPRGSSLRPERQEASSERKEKKTAGMAVPVPGAEQKVGPTWEEFVHAVKQANGFLGALLEHTSIYQQDEKIISLGLPEKMAFLLDKLQETKNVERTENFLQAFWKDHRKVEIHILDSDHLHSNMSPKALEEQARKKKEKKEAHSVENHPLVKAAEEVFQDNMTKVSVQNVPPPQNP
jgi:DNA polymerase-3 subunit gamma/tau